MDTLEKTFEKLYLQFRANYYRRMVEVIGVRDGSLTATDNFCVEIIYLLEEPTITEFASFLNISVPNAIYKINSLITKGYVVKVPSQEDRRECHLKVTEKFLTYYRLNTRDNARLMESIRQTFNEHDLAQLETIIRRALDLMTQNDDES